MHAKFSVGLGVLAAAIISVACVSLALPQIVPPDQHSSSVSENSRSACEALRGFRQPDVSIVDASIVLAGQVHKNDLPPERRAGADASPGLPVSGAASQGSSAGSGLQGLKAYCRVEARIEGNIGFLTWMPVHEDWNGRLLGVGNGGDAGSFQINGIARAIREGMVGTTTDAGHQGNTDPLWAMSRKKEEDYVHRAQHLTAVLGRELVTAYYGSEPRKSYFSGCSGGGRQALTELQMYPADYDGIVAGAPAPQQDVQMARKQWIVRLAEEDPAGALPDAKWDMVVAEVAKQCDPADGLTDRLISNPMACGFDVTKLACSAGQSESSCLTPAQVGMVNKFYGPFIDENGVQRGPASVPGLKPLKVAPNTGVQAFGHAVHQNPNWTRNDLVIGRDIDSLNRILPFMGLNNPDLTRFAARGGKAIIYHGMADQTDMVTYSIQNYDRVLAHAPNGGQQQVQETARLFLAPNVGHCGGPDGPSWQSPGQVGYDPAGDPLALVIRWVEEGKAPDQILASQIRDGKVVRTRPLCVYPKMARYVGTGSIDEAENFVCR